MKRIGKKQKTEVLRGPMRFPSARHHVVTGPRVGPSTLTGHIHVWAASRDGGGMSKHKEGMTITDHGVSEVELFYVKGRERFASSNP
jgi:hypothetical protein